MPGTAAAKTPADKAFADARFMRSLLAASDDCIKVLSLEGKLTFMSEGGQRVMEISDFNAIQGCPWPDFWAGQGHRDAIAAIAAAREGRSARFQGMASTGLGNARWWDVQVSPIIGSDGKPESILSVSRDITELKLAEERQNLIAQELKHRIKNTVAMMQAIANQTLRSGETLEAARDALQERLLAMGRAHDMLTQSAWSRAVLGDLVRQTLATHSGPDRVDVSGPDVELSSRCALAMALALYELATNALKYGALSVEGGRVTISWLVIDGTFRFDWTESGGPPVTAPTRTGFGSRMIERALAGYFSGCARVDYAPTGLVFTLSAPVEALTRD